MSKTQPKQAPSQTPSNEQTAVKQFRLRTGIKAGFYRPEPGGTEQG
jgi:hypothetical protein